MTIKHASHSLGTTPTTIGRLLDRMASAGIVTEITGRRRSRVYRYGPFLEILADDPEPG